MPCVTKPYDPTRGPILEIGVSLPRASLEKGGVQAFGRVNALIDTGSDVTCVTHNFARWLGLLPMGRAPVAGTTGVGAANYYLCDVELPLVGHHGKPAPIPVRDIRLYETNPPGSQHYEALLGRDIIGRGVLQIAGSTFTFCL